ncbi:limonene-1,2-epoxide hydrolase family protein [Nocardia asiatica]|uniref:limonene-1,2-epoxide hydrolase family protein n=1 Tax=Nocardia asiatica TaxID=209252 RepID=UPI003EE0C925
MEMLHPDVDYTMSLPTIRGRRNVVRAMRILRHFDIVHIGAVAADGDTVLSERIDMLSVGPIRVFVWVNARFTVRDGQILSWRDYGDPWELFSGLVRAVLGLLMPGVTRQPPAPLSAA